jgi:hypothetical protein
MKLSGKQSSEKATPGAVVMIIKDGKVSIQKKSDRAD